MDQLFTGFKAMPPRGMCKDRSSQDLRTIVLWMSKSSAT
ncbi:cytochrome C [Pseudomonas sp. v388]|nr:cytochrome C [Pseudomonas sp. v388]